MQPFRFDRSWAFDVGVDRLWDALTRTEDYRRWWPWLREFSGDGLVPGGRSTCVVRAPIPYSLRFTVEVTDLVPGERIDAAVEGDLAGPARLEVRPLGATLSSEVRLSWEMQLRRPVLRGAARVGRPVMEWGHDWVVSTGFEQFCGHALRVQDPHDDSDQKCRGDDRGARAAGYGA